jgi:ribosomal protein S18 acetylase RimI-like enzyme
VLALWLNLISHHRALSDDYPVLPGIASVITAELRRAAARDTCRLFVAELDGRLVGFLFAEIEVGAGPSAEPAPAWVHELWVEPAHRAQGIAAQLLAEGDAFFASRGVKRVSVRVESSNAAALEFWSRLGFGERARILERIS